MISRILHGDSRPSHNVKVTYKKSHIPLIADIKFQLVSSYLPGVLET